MPRSRAREDDLRIGAPRCQDSAPRPESATCLDRRWEPGDLRSSGAERGGLARESAAVAPGGCSGSRTACGLSCSPGEVMAQERSALPEVALPSSPAETPGWQEESRERGCTDRGGPAQG